MREPSIAFYFAKMIHMHYLDFATLFSLLALNLDIALQNRRVYFRKSSKDISVTGLLIRYIAIFVLLINISPLMMQH